MLSHASRQLPSWLIFDVRQRFYAKMHIILCLFAVAFVVGGCASGQRPNAALRTNSGDIAIEGIVESFRRKAQHMYLHSGAGVSFDVAKIKITRPASLAGGVMNVAYTDRDRSFWELGLPKGVAFEMPPDEYARLVEVLKDDRHINGFSSSLLRRVRPNKAPEPTRT